MDKNGLNIHVNKNGRKIVVVNRYIDYSKRDLVYYGAYDAIYIKFANRYEAEGVLKRINPVVCNESSYLPLFVSKNLEGKVGLLQYIIDGYTDDLDDPEITNKIEEIFSNIKKSGISPEEATVNTASDIFLRLYRYKITRNDLKMVPKMMEKTATGYCYPLFELFHNWGYYHLREHFSFEQISYEKGTFRQLRFVDRVHLCPKCQHSHMIYTETCPKCGSSRLHVEQVIHHFACANISRESSYNVGGQLICPKCHERLMHIGVDYDRPSSLYYCETCGDTFLQPVTKAFCTFCKNEVNVKELIPHDMFEFEITPEGAGNIAHSLYPFSASNSYFDNYMSFYAFRSRLRLIIEKKINQDQIVGLAIAKIWNIDENGRTTVAHDAVIATACRVFANKKVASTRNIIYVNNSIYVGEGQQHMDQFREEIAHGAKILSAFIKPNSVLYYTIEVVGDEMTDVKTFIQHLEFASEHVDGAIPYDEAVHLEDTSSPEAVIGYFKAPEPEITDAPLTDKVPEMKDVEMKNRRVFNYMSWGLMICVAMVAALIGHILWIR